MDLLLGISFKVAKLYDLIQGEEKEQLSKYTSSASKITEKNRVRVSIMAYGGLALRLREG